jgi:HEAT repeat protein
VATLITPALRHEKDVAIEAFRVLVEDRDDRLLATHPVERLIAFIGKSDPDEVKPVIERMLGSEVEAVREAGGRLAAYAGLELGLENFLAQAVGSADPATRKGAAIICANMVGGSSDPASASSALRELFEDQDPAVRAAAAEVAGALRDQDLETQVDLLRALITSAAFPDALTQLLFTLERTTSEIDELALLASERFLEVHRDEIGNIETGAAGDARHVAELLVRTYSQSATPAARSRALDLIDELMLFRAYGIEDLVAAAER